MTKGGRHNKVLQRVETRKWIRVARRRETNINEWGAMLTVVVVGRVGGKMCRTCISRAIWVADV